MPATEDLFTSALGLTPPWEVIATAFDAGHRRLDLHLDFPTGARFACPEAGCDQGGCPVHDTEAKTWRHLDFFQHQAYLHARVPRVRCPEHGVHQVTLAWARPGSGFTLLFEALLMAMLAEMPVNAVAALVGEHDTRLWRLLHHHVDQAREQVDMHAVTAVGMDETSAKRGQDYVTLFVDLDAPNRRVLFATPGRDHATVQRFAADLTRHGGHAAQIRDVTLDFSAAFAKGVRAHLPKAYPTFDRFHLTAQLTKAVDEARRAETRTRPELKGSRWVWLKRVENLTARQAEQLAALKDTNLATARAYRWRLDFDLFYQLPAGQAEAYLEQWCDSARRSRLVGLQRFVRLVDDHWEGVIRWHWTRINTGVMEGINSLVQAVKRRARGYRTTRNLIAMIYMTASRLDFSLTHTN